jgi:hypothetical protein
VDARRTKAAAPELRSNAGGLAFPRNETHHIRDPMR